MARLRVYILACALGLSTVPAPSRAVAAASPLARFVGTWQLRGSLTVPGAGQPRSFELDQECRWTARDAFLACIQVDAAHTAEATLLWWDARAKTYRFSGLQRDGSTYSGTISIAGPLWTWTSAFGSRRFRTTNRWRTPDLVAFRAERSADGGKTWHVFNTGTERRVSKRV